jgi:hypothetical protein
MDLSVMNKEPENDESWEVYGFMSLVYPYLSDNTHNCSRMLVGEEFEDINLLGAPIIKSQHVSDGSSKHIRTQQDSAYEEKAKPGDLFNLVDFLVVCLS